MCGQVARYYYRKGMVMRCIRELLRSEITYRNIGMLFTVFIPPLRRLVLRNFKVGNIPHVEKAV